MANGKKSFILYCDLLHTLKHLDNEQSGKLFKHILSYVNDENPVTDDPFIKIAFEPIKQSLKRDLRKYEQRSDSRSNAGKLGNLKRYYLDIYEKVDAGHITLEEGLKLAETRKASQSEKKLASVADNDNDSDSDSVSEYSNEYTKSEFLKDWNEIRTKQLKKPSHVNRLSYEGEQALKDICTEYNPEEIRNALIGLFKQEKLPNGNTVMQSNPNHFLKHFESYLQAYHDRNTSLYGKKETA